MAGGIFISYRREDSQHAAGRLVDRLSQHFGRDRIFMDVDAIEPGLDFLDVINTKVAESFVFLVVIGPGWVNAAGPDRRRRLDNPDDLVRLEIEAALKRDIRVIPVLVDGAPVPSSAELPSSLQSLARRQSIRLTHDAFGTDADRLIATLSRLPGIAQGNAPVRKGAEPSRELELSREQLLKLLEVVPIDSKHVYRWPSIPPEKEKNARAAAGVPPDENIALLVDLTASGSAKDALLLGGRRLYYRFWQNAPPVTALAYSELREHQITKKIGVTPFGGVMLLIGIAFFWVFLIPTIVALIVIGVSGAGGSILSIGLHKMHIRSDRPEVFALLYALKAQVGR